MIVIVHRFVCDDCSYAREQSFQIPEGGTVPVPYPPYGWQYIWGRLICIKHTVKLTVKPWRPTPIPLP